MNRTRSMDIYSIPPGFSVTLIGAGGIGALAAVTLAKMGIMTLKVFDGDTVEDENIQGQFHKISDIGNSKVAALRLATLEYADTAIDPFYGRVEENTVMPNSNIIISAVDSINARKEIWEAVVNQKMYGSKTTVYIDARMAAEQYQHFAVEMKPEDMQKYHSALWEFREEDVEELPCTAKATFYTAAASAGHIGAVIRNVLKKDFKSHRLIHYIPQEQILKLEL